MGSAQSFQPQWASAPGETIAEILRRKKIDFQSFASDLGGSEEEAQCLIDGACAIDQDIAKRLCETLGGSVSFWLNREAQYRDDVARLQGDRESDDSALWLRELPVRDMVNFGWISRFTDRSKQAKECLRFFGASSIAQWRSSSAGLQTVVAFRTSATFKSSSAAVAAWLRQGEILAANMKCAEWNAEKLRSALPELRKLTRVKDPAQFIPALQKICAECGVAVIIARAPQGCRASGATKFVAPNKAMLLLSFRYRTDDHFWFTFFHEVGHLLLHDNSALFIEGADFISTHEEREADAFSENFLIPPAVRDEMLALSQDHKKIMRFARSIGVSPGIVVGQLQHAECIPPARMNFLKTRFAWTVD